MQEQGWVKVFRSLLDKPIWLKSTPEHKTILIALLLMVNHKEKEWEWNGHKYTVASGQFITSLDSIVKKCGKGISIQNVRSTLARFNKLGFLTNESTKTGRLITIVNWGLYQDENMQNNKDSNKEVTKNQQRGNKEVTTNKNDKNENKYIYTQVINYLNEKIGAKYKDSAKKTQDLINARMNDGYIVDDFKKVIDNKVCDWFNNEYEKYLRPSTLFGNKFEGYLNQKNGQYKESNINSSVSSVHNNKKEIPPEYKDWVD
ncbi:MAG: conserved phage C-terminal domain-containing protein [Clostridiaceae bacterium]